MCLVFQKILLFHTNILIPNTHPYVWFKLKFKFGLRVMSVLKCFTIPIHLILTIVGPFYIYKGIQDMTP